MRFAIQRRELRQRYNKERLKFVERRREDDWFGGYWEYRAYG